MYSKALSVYSGCWVFSILNDQVNQMQTSTFLWGLTVAIGDFRPAGFSKSVSNTRFTSWDTRLFLFLGWQ